jgi:hypothetical protein
MERLSVCEFTTCVSRPHCVFRSPCDLRLRFCGDVTIISLFKQYMDLNSMASDSNKIFGNSNEPASYDCRTKPTRAGVLSSIVAYSGEYSSYFTDLPLSFTGTDSIIGRAFAILNGTDECVDPQTPNSIRAKVMCFTRSLMMDVPSQMAM